MRTCRSDRGNALSQPVRQEELEQQQEDKLNLEEKYASTEEQAWREDACKCLRMLGLFG